jgi:hypothetical protein
VPEPGEPVVNVAVTVRESPGIRMPVIAVQLTEAPTLPSPRQVPEYRVSTEPVFVTVKVTWFPTVAANRIAGSVPLAGVTVTPTWARSDAPNRRLSRRTAGRTETKRAVTVIPLTGMLCVRYES